MWSWLLTVVGCTGFWLTMKYPWGWLINLASQALWLTYAISTKQWGFIPACGMYGFVFGRNYLKARDVRAA